MGQMPPSERRDLESKEKIELLREYNQLVKDTKRLEFSGLTGTTEYVNKVKRKKAVAEIILEKAKA